MKQEDSSVIHEPEQILEKRTFLEKFIDLKVPPESDAFKHFFQADGLNHLENEEADSCEGLLTLQGCANSLSHFKNNKTPGSDGFTVEFYTLFWDDIEQIMVDIFNYAFKRGSQWGCSKHGTRLIFWMFHATRLTPLRPS